jgi:hypothetical protein
MKEEIKNDAETLRKNQAESLEIKSSKSHIKNSEEIVSVKWIKLKTEYQELKIR